ncbi:MAG: Twin-arginine translocation pathway signal [Clostridiales bacterium 38_11]|nr:MAG: Twin-arginine translocation pathway signal [Clostridiales bacterium 38_11]
MKTRIIRFTLIFLLVIVVGVVYASAENAKYGGVLKIGLSTDPTDLNPFIQSGGSSERVKTLVYNSLLMYDMQGNLLPSLAESWEMPDEKTYIFHIRKDAKFHNGQPVTAEDVRFSIETIMDISTGAFLYKNFTSSIENVTVIDEKTIKIVLKSKNASFLGLLGMLHASIVSKDWVEAGHDLNNEMMGTGAFKFVTWDRGVKLTFVRNDNYWREGLPYLDGIELVPIKDEDVRTNALIAGEVDFVDFPPWKAWNEIESKPDLTISKSANFAMVLFFNPHFEPFANPKVRQAIKYAIDDKVIAEFVFFGHAVPTGGGFLPPGHWATTDAIQNFYTYDPEKARSLIAEAGYPNGFKVKLLATSTYGMHRMTAEVIQDQLKKIGIDVQLELAEWGSAIERRAKGQYDFMVYAAGLTRPDPDFYSDYIESTAGFMAKPVGYKDEMTDRLLELGRLTLDPELRKRVYSILEMRFLEQCPIAVLARRETGFAHKTKVKGFLNFAFGYMSCVEPFDGVWIDQ